MKQLLSLLSLGLLLLSPGLLAAAESDSDEEDSLITIAVGVQGVSVDAEQDRDGRFNRYQDRPSGLVIDYLRFARLLGEDGYVDFSAVDALQDDERVLLRLGLGGRFRGRYEYDSVPMVFGNRARSVLGGDYRIGDFIQQLMEDPDGNGVPFYTDLDETAGDNALVRGMANDLLTGTSPFDLELKRRSHDLDLRYDVSPLWSVGFDYQLHESRGTQPLGSGTYQRITDVDADGATDYDYFFSIRGVELPAIVDYDTVNTSVSALYRQDRWFGDFRYTYSEFENANPHLLYDNPFWFTGTEATSGSRRGLWEEGRASQPPSNDSWNLALTGGVDLGKQTRLTAAVNIGEHKQDEPFAAITTNPALVGKADLNGDGVIDGADDPTSLALLPQSSLSASSDITSLNLRLTSRPADWVRVNASWRSYEYDGGTSDLVMPARTEYIESRIKTDFKGSSLRFIPHNYKRENLKVEGIFDASKDFRVAAFFERESYDWPRYADTEGNVSRDAGNRSVEGTDDDTLGLRVYWDGSEAIDARLSLSNSDRDFSGEHVVGFSGQLESLRQYDIANRERDAVDLRVNLYPRDGVTAGIEIRDWSDNYPDSVYGFLEASSTGWTIDTTCSIGDRTSLYLYLDGNEVETDMHLRTKCSNCTPPAGAGFEAPWGVPNYDWFTNYTDEDVSFGGSINYASEDDRDRFDLDFSYTDAEIQQLNRNPATPRDLGKPGAPPVGVALAVNFPDQTNTFTNVEAKYLRKLNSTTSLGVMYTFEDWDLDDFQVQQLQAYGANFLSVDDASRFLLLDSWYGSFDAHVLQFFVKLEP